MITAPAKPSKLAWGLAALATLLGTSRAATDPYSPIQYPGMQVVVDSQGVQAPGYRFKDDCRKPTPWQAHWIWLRDASAPGTAMFRKELTLAEAPEQVRAWMSADMKYLLWINGRLASRGPVDIGRDFAGGKTRHWFYDSRDLTPYFRKGSNVIAALVFRQWPIGFTGTRGQPGFLFEAQITDADGQEAVVKTDTHWRSKVAAQFPKATTFDAHLQPVGWRLPGFDDSAWFTSRQENDIWSPLIPSEIPPCMEARYPVLRIDNATGGVKLGHPIVATSDGRFRVVFDRVLSAYPTLRIKGGDGAVVTIKAHRQVTFQLDGRERTLAFPFMDEIAPSYTVELQHVTKPVEILDPGAVFTSQPVAYRGSFACNDAKLNRLWDVSRWAVQICLQTHHLDSPNHQEPISDPGDYVVEAMVNNYAFTQPWLARQDLRKFAWILKDENYHNFHISYSLDWLQMLMDYYDYTGDRSLVVELAPYVAGLLDTYATWRGPNGLISEAPNYMFMDWVTIAGFNCHNPPAVIGQGYLTALYYHGLAMASRVAALTGDTARVAKYATLRAEVAKAFNRELWVPARGLYRDGKPFQSSVKPHQWLPADKDIETFSPHVNLLAVLYNLAPKHRQRSIVERVLAQKPLNTSPWFMHWVFQAIDHVGLFDRYGTAQLRRWQIVPQTQSFREMWHRGDLSHGWCSTPLVQMSAHILGVQPTTPGFGTFVVQPHVCDLTWARGVVPTPHGNVVVSWRRAEHNLALDVTVPAGTTAEVILPHKTARVQAGRHHFDSPD